MTKAQARFEVRDFTAHIKKGAPGWAVVRFGSGFNWRVVAQFKTQQEATAACDALRKGEAA